MQFPNGTSCINNPVLLGGQIPFMWLVVAGPFSRAVVFFLEDHNQGHNCSLQGLGQGEKEWKQLNISGQAKLHVVPNGAWWI